MVGIGVKSAGAQDSEAPSISVSVYFSVDGVNLAQVKLPLDARVRHLAQTVATAALRARKAAFPCSPRLAYLGEELDHSKTLEEAGLVDGAELLADAYPTVVTASSDGFARLWNAETGECEKILQGHTGPLLSVTFSPDSKLIATSSEDKTVKLWSPVNGECWQTLREHRDTVNSCAFSPDGMWLVTASNDTLGKVWSSTTGRCHATLEGHGEPVVTASFSHDGATAITMSQGGKAKVWNPKTGVLLRTLHHNSTTMYQTSFSPDGKLFVTAPGDFTAQVCEMSSGRCERVLKGHTAMVVYACFAPAACAMKIRRRSSSPRSPSPARQLSMSMSDNMHSVCSFGATSPPASPTNTRGFLATRTGCT